MGAAGAWDEVWRGGSEAEAEIVAGSLRAAGFRARAVGGPAMAGVPALGPNADGWAVAVPISQAAAARRLVARTGDPNVARPRSSIDWRGHQVGLAVAMCLIAAALLVVLGSSFLG